MKRYYLLFINVLFFLFYISCVSYGSKGFTFPENTDGNLTSYDFANDSKRFTLPENADMWPSEKWRFSLYVDEYGMSTKEPYIAQKTTGKFSNIATREDECDVTMLVDKDTISFVIYEYGRHLASGSGLSDIYFLTFDDEIKAKAYSGKNRFYVFEGAQDIINRLAEGKTCNVRLRGGKYTTSTYYFSIDGKGFANWLNDVLKYSP